MGSRVDITHFGDFTGGRNSHDPGNLIAKNQSPDCQNINILDRGFEKRRGNTAFNSSAMVSASTPVVGLGYIKFVSGTEFLNAVAGTKFFTSSGLSGTMADATGVLTITAGQDNKWKAVEFNDLQIWFGGAPDAPFKYSGSGNGTALGGTPPSAKTAFVANNRVFAISTAANPSRIHWPILGNPEDWTGAGSGTSDVNKNDGEELLTGVPLNADSAILFKNTSTHFMTLISAPFSVIQLQKGIGAAGRWCVVPAEGKIYFITQSLRMMSTADGVSFEVFPDSVKDLWDRVNAARIPDIEGIYYPVLRQIHWYVSLDSATANNAAIIWDLEHKCWLFNPTGHSVNAAALLRGKRLFTGHYDGKIYEQDVASTFTDASETSPGAIDGYWQFPWLGQEDFSGIVHPLYLSFGVQSESSGLISVDYGFDYALTSSAKNFSLVANAAMWDVAQWDVDKWGGSTNIVKRLFTVGRGNVFSYRIRNNRPSESFRCNGSSVAFRQVKDTAFMAA